MDRKKLPKLLRGMLRISGECWYAYNSLGKPTRLFWDFETEKSTPIASYVFRLNGGKCEKGAQFIRTCGHRECVNPEHLVIKSFSARLNSYIDRRGPGECWPWIGAKEPGGYGLIAKDHTQVAAHRAAYEQARGPIPPGLLVRHLCNNPVCCNPAHLATGTAADNAADSVAAGVSKRMGRHAGDRDKAAAAVQAVRRGMRIGEAAALHGVTRVTIWRNMRGVR